MDNNKKFLEGLLKADGIDPAGATKAERIAFAKMLNEQSKPKQSKPAYQPDIWRIIMKSRITKFAAAAAIIIAVLIGINQFTSSTNEIAVAKLVHGPQTHSFNDGSTVKLAEGAEIGLYDSSEKRGFEHLAGEIEVTVTKGKGEFVVVTPFGVVKALGTVFGIDIVTTDSIDILAVEVKEGSVEVSNPQGSKVIKANQGVTVEKDKAPYDFRQDENLPLGLVERIQAMLDAMEAGDKHAWLANFNINAFYDLAKGKVEYKQHPDWFSGMSPDDANRFRQALANVNSPEEIKDIMLADISDDIYKLYVRSVTLEKDGKHATAICVKKQGQAIGFTPQWTYFDGDWWQTDD